MGMVMVLTPVSDENMRKIRAFPPLVWKVVCPEEPEMFDQYVQEYQKPGFLGRFRARRAPAHYRDIELTEGEGGEVDLDKSWHGIHYLLTRTAWEGEPPFNFLICGGEALSSMDTGYGPPRLVPSTDVRRICDALFPIDGASLAARFDPSDMMRLQIYPEIWDREDDPMLEYCVEYFEVVKKVVEGSMERGFGLIISIQ